MVNPPDPPMDSATSRNERRRAPRYALVAMADLTDSDGAMLLSGKITEIGRNGCYVETLNALPVGTLLKVLVFRDQHTFVTKGKIIYIHERDGMGVAFLDPPQDQLKILDSWLAEFPSA